MTDALTKEPFVALFAALNVELPLCLHDEDVGVVLDADKQDVFVVDVNAVRADEQATNIAGLIMKTVNSAGGFPPASPPARSSIAGRTPAAVQNPKPPARTAAGAHSPEPRWFVGDIESFEEVRRSIYEGDDFRNKLVAVCQTPEQARLAAAAPAMLAALKLGRELAALWGSRPLPAARIEDVTAQFRAASNAAIAKAEGC